MTKDEALMMALQALENLDGIDTETECVTIDVGEEITAIKEALAQQQEPVAWMKIDNYLDDENLWCEQVTFNQNEDGKPLYASPPAKPWVGLTHADFDWLEQMFGSSVSNDFVFADIVCVIEAKLKEKNT